MRDPGPRAEPWQAPEAGRFPSAGCARWRKSDRLRRHTCGHIYDGGTSMRLLRSFQYPTPIRLGLYRLAPGGLCRNDVPVYAVGCRACGEVPPCPGGARGHDGLRVAGARIFGFGSCRRAPRGGPVRRRPGSSVAHRGAAGTRPAVSGASVSARLAAVPRQCSERCRRLAAAT